ncbi:cytochrome c-type biogenesis protein [Marivivens marinus]|uniref:cytochrome c-type biogenesis protein n=1 Tax=Marivivens marinus TaxID=3110173 RepID=UPI003B8456F3
MKRLILILTLLASPLWAVQPDEILDDPALESRAREISKGLRCPVCQNESIDESNAALSRELRILLRERLVAGDSDAEAVDFIVTRYGEFVLLNPTRDGANLILWYAAPAMLIIALGIGWATIRRRGGKEAEALTEDEKARLDEILRS